MHGGQGFEHQAANPLTDWRTCKGLALGAAESTIRTTGRKAVFCGRGRGHSVGGQYTSAAVYIARTLRWPGTSTVNLMVLWLESHAKGGHD